MNDTHASIWQNVAVPFQDVRDALAFGLALSPDSRTVDVKSVVEVTHRRGGVFDSSTCTPPINIP